MASWKIVAILCLARNSRDNGYNILLCPTHMYVMGEHDPS